MKKFIQNTFFVLLSVGFWGYYSGLRLNNYQEFINNILNKYSVEKEAIKHKKNPSERTLEPKGNAREVTVNERQPLPKNPFADIDKQARQCPQKAETSIASLARYLEKNTASDLEKARAIYVWLTENISYDDDEFNNDKFSDMSAESVLARRKTVCEGISNLYLALGEAMNLKIEKVVGYSKGYSYSVGSTFKEANHAWNVIKIDGNWRIFDATWGQGNGTKVDGKLVSKKEFDDYWFNVDPYEAIFSHLPEDSKWGFVQPALTLKSYERMPEIDHDYFNMGFDGQETYQDILTNKNLAFPKSFDLDTYVEMWFAPKYETLFIGESYPFKFYIPQGLSAAIIDNDNNWTYFEAQKGQFKANYTPNTEGPLHISIKYERGNERHKGSYSTILIYNVKKK